MSWLLYHFLLVFAANNFSPTVVTGHLNTLAVSPLKHPLNLPTAYETTINVNESLVYDERMVMGSSPERAPKNVHQPRQTGSEKMEHTVLR
eukprot:scaffold5108_cov172-Amphora_coffeaeformis.AAC.29